jgi:hypothetical protein
VFLSARAHPVLRAGTLLAVVSLVPAAARAEAPSARSLRTAEAVDRLARETGSPPTVSLHPGTGVARFLRPAAGREALTTEKTADPGRAGRAFLLRHGELFGVRDPDRELLAVATQREASGATHLRYRQVHRGVPVFAGELLLHFSPEGALTAANGTFLP